MKILFLTLYPKLQPSTRFRVMQFLPYLDKDISYHIGERVSEKIFSKYHGNRSFAGKLLFHFFEVATRLKDILLSFGYDAVFLQKGITAINLHGMGRLLFLCNKNVIFDFDDAVTIGTINTLTRFPWTLLEKKNQALEIVRRAKTVIVGNERLKNDIAGMNGNIIVIPTPVDTDYYRVNPDRYTDKERVTILWSGNASGHADLKVAAAALAGLSNKYPLNIAVMSDARDDMLNGIFGETKITFTSWSLKNEKAAFNSADIGIMPLHDTLWARRKCAYKALLYMANGIPVVASPVGVSGDIIKDGENGFIAATEKDWADKLELLIKDAVLRKRIGLNGRKTVENDFSLSKWGPYWNNIIAQTVKRK